jgi:type IV pilus assembly protein PilB
MTVKINKKLSKKSFTELILERLGISLDELKKFQEIASKEKKSVLQVLVEKGYSEEDIAKIKAEYFGFKFDKLTNYTPPDFIKDIFDKEFLKKRHALPVIYENGVLTIAMYEPTDVITINEIIEKLKSKGYEISEVNIIITTRSQIEEKIELIYEEDKKLEELISTLQEVFSDVQTEEIKDSERITETSSPIVILANKIVEEAYYKKASDIHIQPEENKVVVRYRIDGSLHDILELPKYVLEALITRYKIMSNLKIDEKRVPQDGRIDFSKYNPSIKIDLRVSTVPTIYGEDLVMRILDKTSVILNLDKLGFTKENLTIYREVIKKPYGMILHTGPTGSGKTTTLYSALKEIDTPDKKILTVEDPVEYTLGGTIVQTSVNVDAGYTFAKALKAFLRHDPDVILVGEIRDLETAKIAVEASLTGHLVFSTLHTNDSVSTITRLKEMGIESYLIGDSLLLVVSQRLAKKICLNCKEEYTPSKKEKLIIQEAGFEIPDMLFRGKGCKFCNFTGYKGRTGIHEVLKVSDKIREMLVENASTEEIKKQALKEGLKTLRQDAVYKAIKGIITIEEVERTTLT